MTDNITDLHGKDAGVVSFGARQLGFSAIVEGREIPKLRVKERGAELITINLDGRWEIDVPRQHSGSICWMIANAMAIGEGYAFLGSANKDKPFAPEVIGPYGGST